MLAWLLLLLAAAEPVPPAPAVETEIVPVVEPGLTLDELTALAEQMSPNLRAAAAQIGVRRGETLQSGLYPNPRFESSSQQWGGSQTQVQQYFEQEFVTKQKLQLNRAAASRTITQAEAQYFLARYKLLTDLRKGFFSTLVAQRRVQILSELVGVATKSKDAAEALQKGGEGTAIDTLFLEVELQKAEVSLQNAQVQLQANRKQLAAVVGMPEYEIESLQGHLAQEIPNYHDELVHHALLTQNSQLTVAMAEVERQSILIRRAEVEPFPNVTAGAGYLHSAGDLNDFGILSVSVPLPLWNRNQGNIAATQSASMRAREDYQTIRNELYRTLAEALGEFQAAEHRAERFETQILPRAQRSLALTQTAYRQGQFDVLRLLQAQRAFVEARLTYLDAQNVRWSTAAEIAGLTQRDVFP